MGGRGGGAIDASWTGRKVANSRSGMEAEGKTGAERGVRKQEEPKDDGTQAQRR